MLCSFFHDPGYYYQDQKKRKMGRHHKKILLLVTEANLLYFVWKLDLAVFFEEGALLLSQ